MSGSLTGGGAGAGGWGGMMAPFGGGMSNPYAMMSMASMTPQQRQQMMGNMYAMQLMNQASAAPQRSGWGAANQAIAPGLGAAMWANPGWFGLGGQGGAAGPAISGVNNQSLVPATAAMNAAPNFYAGGVGGPGF